MGDDERWATIRCNEYQRNRQIILSIIIGPYSRLAITMIQGGVSKEYHADQTQSDGSCCFGNDKDLGPVPRGDGHYQLKLERRKCHSCCSRSDVSSKLSIARRRIGYRAN